MVTRTGGELNLILIIIELKESVGCDRRVARGGGRVGAVAPPPPKCKTKKRREREREKKKEENKVACMHVKLPPFNHFQSKIKYKFVLYEENTGHMHQIAPLTTSKRKKLPHPPPPRSLHSLGRFAPSHVIFTAPLKLNPGYATGMWPKGGGVGYLSPKQVKDKCACSGGVVIGLSTISLSILLISPFWQHNVT